MTEPTNDLDERLARLSQRRGPATGPTPTPTTAAASDLVRAATPGQQAVGARATTRTAKRGAPAGTAKIITAGASATAMLGLIAAYGAVDRAVASTAHPPSPVVAPAATPAPAPPVAQPVGERAPAAPTVVVVWVDALTGAPIDIGSRAPEPPVAADPADAHTSIADLQPVQPVAIDLAVPALPPSGAPPAVDAAAVAATSAGS